MRMGYIFFEQEMYEEIRKCLVSVDWSWVSNQKLDSILETDHIKASRS